MAIVVFDGSTELRMRAQYSHLSHGYDRDAPRAIYLGHYSTPVAVVARDTRET